MNLTTDGIARWLINYFAPRPLFLTKPLFFFNITKLKIKKNMENIDKSTYLSFTIKEEMFAIPVTKVLEVLQRQKITRVPNSPEHVKGVINFRGEIIPVFETRLKFGLPKRENEDKYVIIVLQIQTTENNETLTIGAVADTVKDVLTIANTRIKPVPQMSKNYNTEYLDGITKITDKFALLLNTDKVFSEEEITAIIENSEQ